MTSDDDAPTWRRTLAYFWYMWGASLAYWGLRTGERGLFRAAAGAYGRALRAWPAFSGAYFQRGVLRERELGERDGGLADLTRAIGLSPEWAEPYLRRGLIRRFHGDAEAAIDDLSRFLELGGDPGWREEAERQIAALRQDLGSP